MFYNTNPNAPKLHRKKGKMAANFPVEDIKGYEPCHCQFRPAVASSDSLAFDYDWRLAPAYRGGKVEARGWHLPAAACHLVEG